MPGILQPACPEEPRETSRWRSKGTLWTPTDVDQGQRSKHGRHWVAHIISEVMANEVKKQVHDNTKEIWTDISSQVKEEMKNSKKLLSISKKDIDRKVRETLSEQYKEDRFRMHEKDVKRYPGN